MRFVFRFLLCLLLSFTGRSVQGLTIPASEDTSSSLSRLTTAGNNSGILLVDATHKAYVFFDLSEIPVTAVVRWAKLRLFLPAVRVKGSGVKVHTVTGEWNEALQSAEPAISSTPVATIGPEKLATKRFVTLDVTSTVQDWINLKTPNEGFAFVTIPNATPSLVTAINFASKEGIIGGLPAELDIEFKPEASANQEPIMVSQLPDALKPLLDTGTFALNDVAQLPRALRIFLAPSITMQPSLSAEGDSLVVQAQGLGVLTYDWKRNGVSLTGGSGALLSTNGLLQGTYTVTVGNGFSTVTSDPVQVEDPLFALIPSGPFTMGNKDFLDAPEHSVHVSGFYAGRTEVTGNEWRSVLLWALENGYEFGGIGEFKGPNYPITDVNWYDALKWCNAKSEKEGLPPCYYTQPNFTPGTVYRTGQVDLNNLMVNWQAGGFRLPTEAEWEKAARGGLNGKLYPTGDTLTALNANINFSVGGTTPVKSYQPNGFGIYDMDGNVNEMCWDFYGPLDTTQTTDPHGPSLGTNRVKRGGLWDNDLRYSTTAYRVGHDSPSFAYRSMGFRLFRSAPVQGFPLVSAPVLSSTSLIVSAQGASPFMYQWFKDGEPLVSGTSSTLPLAGLTGGTYSVMVSNSVGVSISSGLSVSDLRLQLRRIPSGSYDRWCRNVDVPSDPGQKGTVTLSEFYMSAYDTTKEQWDLVRNWARNKGYTDLSEGAGKAVNHPVQTVSWYDVVKWANAASEKDGLTPCYSAGASVYRTGNSDLVTCDWSANGYRLPTEAEWEWASRGGLIGKVFPWGDKISQSQANYMASRYYQNDLSAPTDPSEQNVYHPLYKVGDYPYTSPVGSFSSNGYGLYDMAGNVSQWCWDWYGSYTHENDPRGASSGTKRVLRGGFWGFTAEMAECGARFFYEPTHGGNVSIGFRVIRGSGF